MNSRDIRSRQILACLGDVSRFRFVLSLVEREQCVTELAERVGLSQSCTTRHLQFLEREGVVRGLRQGKRVVFHLQSERPRVRELLAWVVGTHPDLAAGPVSGAEIHVDGSRADATVAAGAARTAGTDGAAKPGEPSRGQAVRSPRPKRSSPPRSAATPTGEPGANPPEPGEAATIRREPLDPAAQASGEPPDPPRQTDLEDWLL